MPVLCNHDTLLRMEDKLLEEKRILRKAFTEMRARVPAAEARKADAEIASRILGSEFYGDAKSVFVYIGVEDEVDTMPLIHKAFSDGKAVFVPRTKADRVMEAVRVEAEEFILRAKTEWPRCFNIPEPPESFPAAGISELDLAIVPSLALDRFGYRLGYGGGYYDRFIETARAEKSRPLFAAVQRAAFVRDEALPREPYDRAVDLIVTENGVVIPVSFS